MSDPELKAATKPSLVSQFVIAAEKKLTGPILVYATVHYKDEEKSKEPGEIFVLLWEMVLSL